MNPPVGVSTVASWLYVAGLVVAAIVTALEDAGAAVPTVLAGLAATLLAVNNVMRCWQAGHLSSPQPPASAAADTAGTVELRSRLETRRDDHLPM